MYPRPVYPRLLVAMFLFSPLCCAVLASEEADILLADFEGPDYGNWEASGEAFGDAPARGTLSGQMNVSGFDGKGLVNTFRGGDKTTGKVVSPLFTIERPFINFLIGGGKHPGKTCMNLLVDGAGGSHRDGTERPAGRIGTARLGHLGRQRPSRQTGAD